MQNAIRTPAVPLSPQAHTAIVRQLRICHLQMADWQELRDQIEQADGVTDIERQWMQQVVTRCIAHTRRKISDLQYKDAHARQRRDETIDDSDQGAPAAEVCSG